MIDTRSTRRKSVDRAIRALVVAFGGALAVVGAITCGGTTGREGLVDPNAVAAVDAATPTASGDDASLDAGWFDVTITYVDHFVPDVAVAVDSGADTAYPWPSCPAYLPVDPSGNIVPLGSQFGLIPAAYAADGSAVPAADGSACATYPWLGTAAIDTCATSIWTDPFSALPPCNWCVDAGSAAQGPGAGQDLHTLCIHLYQCVLRTGCGSVASRPYCLCGDASSVDCIAASSPPGPCATEELAAMQYRASSVELALENYYDNTQGTPHFCGSAMNEVLNVTATLGCFGDGGSK